MELSLAEQTVKNRVSSSLQKLGISSRTEAVTAGALRMTCGCCLFAINDPAPLVFVDRSRRMPA